MTHHVGIWIDHQRAVIVSALDGIATAAHMTSGVDAHPRYSGRPDGGGEKRYEERHRRRLHHDYDEVISRLGTPAALLILGPGEAKLELRERLRSAKLLEACAVDIEAAGKLTDRQVAAKTKAHFDGGSSASATAPNSAIAS